MKKLSRREFLGTTTAGLALAGCGKSKKDEVGINRIIEPGTQPEVFVDGTLKEPFPDRTEGPAWIDNKLYFSNFGNEKKGVRVAYMDGTHRFYDFGVYTNGITPLHNGNLAVCFVRPLSEELPFRSGILEMSPDCNWVDTLIEKYDGLHLGYTNDIVTDSKGGLYFTDYYGGSAFFKNFEIKNITGTPGTSVYYLNSDRELIRLTEWNEFNLPNGCVLSSDGSKLYLTSGSSEVTVFDVNGDGTLSNKRPFAQLKIPDADKKPIGDGMTIDREGNLYVANPQFGIQVFDKSGVSIGIIELPYTTSNCIFGGNDLSTLFVTTFGQKVFSVQTKMKGFQYPI